MPTTDSEHRPDTLMAKSFMDRLSRAAAALVAFATGAPKAITGAAILLSLCAAFYIANALEIRTDLDALLSTKLDWRKEAAKVEQAFPSQGDDIVLVVDADTPERASTAAAAITERLKQRPDLFASVARDNGGAFFDQEALLFLPTADVQSAMNDLIASQPLLGPIAADPSLRGLMKSMNAGLEDLKTNPGRLPQINRSLELLSNALSPTPQAASPLSWRRMISSVEDKPSNWRQFITLLPRLDYSEMMPASRHTAAIRKVVADLALTPANGVRVRVTGSAPIADDELATLKETAGPIGLLMLASMVVILFLAVRSAKLVFAILATVLVGAALTSAVGLLIFHRFNLISVAFIPLFVGLGIDFSIQFAVRARTDLANGSELRQTLIGSASTAGAGLALAAIATAIGFLAFLPTAYRGVSELGLIAGLGMLIALLLTLTLLPALMLLMNAHEHASHPPETTSSRTPTRNKWAPAVLTIAAGLALASAIALPSLAFDSDPMSLRSEKVESMATYRELSRSPETTPNTLNVLAPNLAQAIALADRIKRAPGVDSTATVQSFIPKDQDAKLAIIQDAAMILEPSLNPFYVLQAPSDAENVALMSQTIQALRIAAADIPNFSSARRTADKLETLLHGSAAQRRKSERTLFFNFPVALAQINTMLTAQPITLESLPRDIKRQWLSPTGVARIEIFPKDELRTPKDTAKFVENVRRETAHVSGDAVTVVESGHTILSAFLSASILSAIAITLLLLVALRSLYWTAMTIVPVLLSGLLTFATCVALGMAINLENMIALPLLLGIGVAFNIYFIVAKRSGVRELLRSSLAHAILFSALTTGTAFSALALSAHPGTASMGVLLMIALFWILAGTLIFLPVLLAATAPNAYKIAA